MKKDRLEAFTDAIIAILMTILVLDLKVPRVISWAGLLQEREQLISYFISFLLLAVIWGNHHHMFQIVRHISAKVMWSNTGLMFFLSFVPYATRILDEDIHNAFANQLYTLLFLGINIFWNLLRLSLLKANHHHQDVVDALKREPKSGITFLALIIVFALSFLWSPFGMIGTFVVMIIWIIPYKQIETKIREDMRPKNSHER